jgi:hypothetical protein
MTMGFGYEAGMERTKGSDLLGHPADCGFLQV